MQVTIPGRAGLNSVPKSHAQARRSCWRECRYHCLVSQRPFPCLPKNETKKLRDADDIVEIEIGSKAAVEADGSVNGNPVEDARRLVMDCRSHQDPERAGWAYEDARFFIRFFVTEITQVGQVVSWPTSYSVRSELQPRWFLSSLTVGFLSGRESGCDDC